MVKFIARPEFNDFTTNWTQKVREKDSERGKGHTLGVSDAEWKWSTM